jgi:hypothetical protein
VRLVWGRVDEVVSAADDYQELRVQVDDTEARAICYPSLAGLCSPGETVLINTTAVDLDLGTGGVHFVVARAPSVGKPVALDRPSAGHIMKLRYTPLQLDVLAVEEPASPQHPIMAKAFDVGGMPVVCCGLHSQVPLVAAAIKTLGPAFKVAYVMTDFAALPLSVSRVVRESVETGLIDATITAGQAFGGMYEAVNIHSALLAARHAVGADVAIVGVGPGIVGTATPFGHGGVAQGEAVNAAAAVGGRPVAVLRISFADARGRHRVVSHHTLTALSSVALARALIAVPLAASLDAGDRAQVDAALSQAGAWERHARFDGHIDTADLRGVLVASMGRGPEQDPHFFAAAYAAGEAAVALVRGTSDL